MPTAPTKPLIVISYAHEDEPEKPAEGEVKWLLVRDRPSRPAIKKRKTCVMLALCRARRGTPT